MEDIQINDATMPDAAMMDANIDDLFGDAADDLVAAEGLGVALPAAPLPSNLVRRVAEMQWRGCCTKLVWSSSGYIAQIVDHGRKVDLRTTVRNAKSGEWALTEPSKHPIEAPEGVLFEHISASGLGTELAVVDNHGDVHVHSSLNTPLGRLPRSPAQIENAKTPIVAGLNEVVGLHWLAVWPTEFRVPLISPANKIGDKWVTNMRHRDANDPAVHHAAEQRNAFLYVSRDAKFTLMFQNEGIWHATSTRLEHFTTSEEMLSHAALGEDGDHLLLVTHDLTKRFRLYKITITWNASQHNKPNGSPCTLVSPVLGVGHLTAVDNVAAQHADAARLTSLQIIPAIPSLADQGVPTFPTILAVFTRAHLPADPVQQPQEAFSVISRWHLETVTPTLHESFLKLKKANGLTPIQAPVSVLRRQEDIITNRIVTSVKSETYYTVLIFPASDGTVEFRDRVTMTSIEPYGESETVSNLPQSGFEHSLGDHNIHVAVSADTSALARTNADGTLSFQTMGLRYSWQPLDDGISDTRGLIEAAVVCAARQYAILSCSNIANDEVLDLLAHDLSTELRVLFVKEVVKITNRTVDISGIEARQASIVTIKEPLVPRAMSVQLVLATEPGAKERSVMSKFAYCFLHGRQPPTHLAHMVAQPAYFIRPEMLHSLRGMMKWGTDFLVFVVGSLWQSMDKLTGAVAAGNSVRDAFQTVLIDNQRSPVVHLLLNAMSRAYLRFLAQNLPKYLTAVQRVLPASSSVLQRQELQDTYEQCASPVLPFKYNDVELMLQAVDNSVRKAYSTGGYPSDKRTEIELQLMCETTLPEEMTPVLQDLLDNALPTLMSAIDQERLYFRDTAWLGIDTLASARHIDAIRKLPLPENARLRKCRRCGVRMEDVEDPRKVLPWLMNAQRTCICGSEWWLGD